MRALLVALVLLLGVSQADAYPIKRRDLVGAWLYIESYLQLPDGRRINQFSDRPQGIFVILPNGWYSHIIMRDDLPQIASGVMMQATPEEQEKIAKGSLSHYGTWEIDERNGTFTATIMRSDFPNFDGQTQMRKVTLLSRETLKYINEMTNAGPGAVVYATLRRIW